MLLALQRPSLSSLRSQSDLKHKGKTRKSTNSQMQMTSYQHLSTERCHLPVGISRSSAMDLLMKRYHGVCQNAVPKGASKD